MYGIGHAKLASLLILLAITIAGCSGQNAGPDSSRDSNSERDTGTDTEIPVVEPTVLEPTTQSPENLSRAQQQLDSQCAQMDLEEAENMGMPPREFGCEPDGTGIPIKEWLEEDR